MRGQKRVVIKPLFSFISVLTYFHQNEDIPLDMCTTHCKQICPDDFHAAGKERALAEISSLYEYVQKMPDGPQKAHFLKRVSIPQSSLWAYCLVGSMMQKVSSLPNWGSLVLLQFETGNKIPGTPVGYVKQSKSVRNKVLSQTCWLVSRPFSHKNNVSHREAHVVWA